MNETRTPSQRSIAVHRALKKAILDLALAPGTKLPEDSIGEQLGVSRTLVREALLRLNQERLVELAPNRGATVARPSLEEGQDLFVTRMTLEKLVVELLAGNLDRKQRKALNSHVDEEERSRKSKDANSVRLAGEFHCLLAEMTGNATLSRFIDELVGRSSLVLALYGRPHSSECAVSEHRAIIAALVAGDRQRAMDLMAHHLDAITTRALLKSDRPKAKGVLSDYAHAEGLTTIRDDT